MPSLVQLEFPLVSWVLLEHTKQSSLSHSWSWWGLDLISNWANLGPEFSLTFTGILYLSNSLLMLLARVLEGVAVTKITDSYLSLVPSPFLNQEPFLTSFMSSLSLACHSLGLNRGLTPSAACLSLQ